MTGRARAALVVVGLLAAVLLATWTLSAPDTGGPVVAPPEPAPVAALPMPKVPPTPRRPTTRTPTEAELPDHPEGPEYEPRQALPWEPPPLDREYRAASAGLAEAALARRDRFRDCWNAYLDRSGADPSVGRFTIQMTVARVEDGETVVDATVMNEDSDALLERCVADSVADARFEDPGMSTLSIVWPVPIATLPGEIP